MLAARGDRIASRSAFSAALKSYSLDAGVGEDVLDVGVSDDALVVGVSDELLKLVVDDASPSAINFSTAAVDSARLIPVASRIRRIASIFFPSRIALATC